MPKVQNAHQYEYQWGFCTFVAMPKNGLLQRFFSGKLSSAFFWAFFLRISDRLVGLARTIFLAKLLSPEDFGLFGIAVLALSILETISQTGFSQALIQKKQDIASYLNTAWTVQVVRAAVVGIILYFSAPAAAAFFEEPDSVLYFQLLIASLLFRDLSNIGIVFFQKDLDFRKYFVYMFSGTLANLLVSIVGAYLYRSALALVAGIIAENFVRMIASYVLHGHRPRFTLNMGKAREMFGFGKWIFASTVVVFIAIHGDDLYIAKVLGTAALGLYQMAYLISNVMATEITHVVTRVTFPAFSKVQNATDKLTRGFLQTFEVTLAITLPVSIAIMLLAEAFTRIFLDEDWLPMLRAMQILAGAGLIRSVVATGSSLFKATGQPKLDFYLNCIRVAVMAVLIYPLTKDYGLAGASLSVAAGILATVPYWLYHSSKIIEQKQSRIVRLMLTPLLCSIPMIGAVMLFQLLIGVPNLLAFIAVSLLAALVYLFSLYGVFKRFNIGPISTLMTVLSSSKKVDENG